MKGMKGCSSNVGYAGGKKMAHEMAGGGKVQVKGYARGGAVRHGDAKQDKKADAAQDRAMMARHNRLMHAGQKSKLKHGGKVK